MIPKINTEWTRELQNKYVPKLCAEARAALTGNGRSWIVLGVNQKRGRCYHAARTVTVPVWSRDNGMPGYATWYFCHEIAHAMTPGHSHDGVFMEALKRICPPEFVHYELGYQPRMACAAGIRLPDVPVGVNPLKSLRDLERAQRYLARTGVASPSPSQPTARSSTPAVRKNPNTQQHVDALKAVAAQSLLVLYYSKSTRGWVLETPTGREVSYYASREIAAHTVSTWASQAARQAEWVLSGRQGRLL